MLLIVAFGRNCKWLFAIRARPLQWVSDARPSRACKWARVMREEEKENRCTR